jgi:hypothetical protein
MDLARASRRNRHHADAPRRTALVVIDMLNPCEHPEADRLAVRVLAAMPG